MSDTPRTDEALYNGFPDCRSAVDFARQLERELAAATKERDDLKEWKDDAEESWKHIMEEPCESDMKHCGCVPQLKIKLAEATKERDAYYDRLHEIRAQLAEVTHERDEYASALIRQTQEAAKVEAAMTKERDEAIKQRDEADLERSYYVVDLLEIGRLVGIKDHDTMAVKHAVKKKLDAATKELNDAQNQNHELLVLRIKDGFDISSLAFKLDAARSALKEAMKGPVVDSETWARWNKALGEEDGI
jgi:hypothetical protein